MTDQREPKMPPMPTPRAEYRDDGEVVVMERAVYKADRLACYKRGARDAIDDAKRRCYTHSCETGLVVSLYDLDAALRSVTGGGDG